MTPGIHDIPAAEYHADKSSLSSTGARTLVNDCPAVFRWQQDNPTNNRTFDIGTATHLLCLEPERFAERVVHVRGVDKKGNPSSGYTTDDAKAQRDAAWAAGKTPLLDEDLELVRNMRAALHADPLGSQAFIGGEAEKSLYWVDQEFGITCRTRPDYLPPHSRYIVDLKTAASCDPESFGKSAADLGYHQQASFYLDAIEAVTGTRPDKFAFVVIGKRPPHLVTTYWVPPEALAIGDTLNRYARGVFAWCMECGEWPGYREAVDKPVKAFDLRLPVWYLRTITERMEAGNFEPPHITPQGSSIMGDSLTIFEKSAPTHAGQGTQVEQARAIAEVRAAVMIAMDRPRHVPSAIKEMREVCAITQLAERAFFRVSRGGGMVDGDSIHLARELARCWGNIDYGVKELVRDDVRKQSEMLAFAWDLQTNARSEVTFIIPHERHTRQGAKALTGTQEIYENNASFAGRRLREVIFSVLPVWFRAEAGDICRYTLEHGGGKPLHQRVADLIAAFEKMGVTKGQLEAKRGRKTEEFLAEDVAALGVIYKSITRSEVTKEDEFPAEDRPQTLHANADGFEKAAAGKNEKPSTKAQIGEKTPLDAYVYAIEQCDDEAALNKFLNEKASRAFVQQASPDEAERINVAIAAQRRGFAVP